MQHESFVRYRYKLVMVELMKREVVTGMALMASYHVLQWDSASHGRGHRDKAALTQADHQEDRSDQICIKIFHYQETTCEAKSIRAPFITPAGVATYHAAGNRLWLQTFLIWHESRRREKWGGRLTCCVLRQDRSFWFRYHRLVS